MKKIKVGLLFLAISVALLSGCATTSGTTAIADEEKVASIKVGKTTQREVEALFGKPGHISLESNGEKVWSYYRGEVSPKAYVPFLNLTGNIAKSQTLNIRFNRRGVVTDIGKGEGNY